MVHVTEEKLKEIADELETGMKCYLHAQTGELVSFPDPDQFADEVWQEEIDKVDTNPDDYISIHPMTSRDSFLVMEAFAEQLPPGPVQNRLLRALDRPKPFRQFKDEIDNAGDYRQQWFDFRTGRMLDWIRQQFERDTLTQPDSSDE